MAAAGTAGEVLGIFDRENGDFRLIFSDMVSSGGTNLRIIGELLGRKPTLAVLLSSGCMNDKTGCSVLQERSFPFLQKPYSLVDLLRAVKETIRTNP